jgi:hypothetical protein
MLQSYKLVIQELKNQEEVFKKRAIKNRAYKDRMTPVTRSSTLVPGSLSIATMATASTSGLVKEHIINICGFPDDSTMMEIFNQ